MTPVAGTLLSVLAVTLVSLAGLATLAMRESRVQHLAAFLVSFATGVLLGDAFLHLLPEAFAGPEGNSVGISLLVLAGMAGFFVVEKLLLHRHGPVHARVHPGEGRPELVALNVIGDAVHNFIDGALIASSYLVDPMLGVTTTLAVAGHEVPLEIGDFGILVRAGLPVRRAVLLNLASAAMAFLGAADILVAGQSIGTAVGRSLVPVTAGGFIYIALADLVPDLQHDRSLRGLVVQSGLIALGIGVMAALTFLG